MNRQAFATDLGAWTATRAGQPLPGATPFVRKPPRRSLLVSCAATLYALAVAVGYILPIQHDDMRLAWPAPGALIILLSLFWPTGQPDPTGQPGPAGQAEDTPGRGRHSRWTPLLRAVAASWLVFLIIGSVVGDSVLGAAWTGATDILLVCGILAVWKQWTPGTRWVPENPTGIAVLAVIAVLSAIPAVLLEALPIGPAESALSITWDADPGNYVLTFLPTRAQAFTAAVTWAAPIVYGGMLGFLWCHPMEFWERSRHLRFLPVALVVGVSCVVLSALNAQLPLTWLVLIPALWIGLTLAIRPATVATALLASGIWVTAALFEESMGSDGPMRSVVQQATMLLIAVLALTLVLLRERNARLAAQITEEARQAVAQSAVLDAVIDSMTDGVLLVASDGTLRLSNPAARALLGVRSGKPRAGEHSAPARTAAGETGPGVSLAEVNELLQRAASGSTVGMDDGTGSQRYLAITSVPLEHDGESLDLVLLTDVTTAHTRQQELETFAGVVAHDLRNPLGAVALWVDTADMELEVDREAGQEALLRAQGSSRRMRQVIEDYLAYTVGREGVLRTGQVRLADLVEVVTSVYVGLAGGPTLDIDAEVVVQADRGMLRQVLANLVSNAMKYARPGEPAYVQIRAVPDQPPGWVRITVADKGIGIDDGDAETMFAPFGRTARGAAAREGVGLGLALCQAIITRHRGTIGAYRNQWGGTTIEITLPMVGRVLR